MLGQRCRCLANLEPTLDERLVFAGNSSYSAVSLTTIPATTRHWCDLDLMLDQRRREWTNIKYQPLLSCIVGKVPTSPSGWNRFQPQIARVQICGTFVRGQSVAETFGIWIYRGIIRSKLFFLESVTSQFHARILSSEVAQSLKSYGHFSNLRVEIALSHRHVEFFGYTTRFPPSHIGRDVDKHRKIEVVSFLSIRKVNILSIAWVRDCPNML